MSRLTYLPLGGAGEIGMNMYVYGHGPKNNERYIVVDTGVTFSNMESTPGVDLILPDFAWLSAHVSQLEAIFLTHGHQDHVGAIGYMAKEFGIPIYAQEFSRSIAAERLISMGFSAKRIRICEPWPNFVDAGPFSVSYLPISHSIPESAGLALCTSAGTIIHSGDFKLDNDPVVGNRLEHEAWQSFAKDGVVAFMCDSTNATIPGHGRSESSIGASIKDLIDGCTGMFLATTFASHVARLQQISQAAKDAKRSVVLLGRAMIRTVDAAVETGIIPKFDNLISIDQAKKIPRNKLVLLATGSQGEMRSAVANMANGRSHKGLSVEAGDTVLFSSKTIPGNELGVSAIVNKLSRLGVKVVYDSTNEYHVSGHPNQSDLMEMHSLINPALIVPIHGEYRHMSEHAALCSKNGYDSMIVENGTIVDLLNRKVIGNTNSLNGRYFVDGKILSTDGGSHIYDRLHMAREGHLTASIVLNQRGIIPDGVSICFAGLPIVDTIEIEDELDIEIRDYVNGASGRVIKSDKKLADELVSILKSSLRKQLGKSPLIDIAIHRLGRRSG